MGIVRQVNADGATVILVEQSVNRAMSLARHAFFIERGEIRFDGPTAELLERDDLLRPVFLAGAASGGRLTSPCRSPRRSFSRAPSSGSTTDCWPWAWSSIYRTSRVVNFAQGQLGVVAAVFLVKLYYDFGFNYWVALIFAVGLAAAAGALSELVLRRLFDRPRVMVMVATIGLSQVLFLFTVFPFIRPKKLYRAFPVPIHWTFHIGTFLFSPGDVLTLIVAPIVVMALAAFIRLSSWGLAMRAMAENAESARLSGVWVRRTSTVAWTLAGIAVGRHRRAGVARPDERLDRSAQPRPSPAGPAGRPHRRAWSASPSPSSPASASASCWTLLQWNINNPRRTATVELILFVLLQRAAGAGRVSPEGGPDRGAVVVGYGHRRLPHNGRGRCVRRWAAPAWWSASWSWRCFRSSWAWGIPSSCPRSASTASSPSRSPCSPDGRARCRWVSSVSWPWAPTSPPTSVRASPSSLLLPVAGVVTAVVSVLVGLTALRIRGLYLAVSTLGFALFMQTSVLATPASPFPSSTARSVPGCPTRQSTLITRPSLFGLNLTSEPAFAWFSLGVLVLSVLMVRVWRDRGVARRLIAVRDNEIAAGTAGIPVVRTKLLAFALSGFIAGYAGVCLAFATERFSTDTFAPTFSILVVSMVVIGGLDSIPGALLGALYLEGLPAIFGASPTVEFLTSGVGLMAFILYLPGGMAQLLHQFGDLVTAGVENAGPAQGGRRGGGHRSAAGG